MYLLDQSSLAAAIALVFAIYILGGLVYRLLLSPLAHFPGPKIVAATRWYETYYDLVKRGTYICEIQKMHEEYGEFAVRDTSFCPFLR